MPSSKQQIVFPSASQQSPTRSHSGGDFRFSVMAGELVATPRGTRVVHPVTDRSIDINTKKTKRTRNHSIMSNRDLMCCSSQSLRDCVPFSTCETKYGGRHRVPSRFSVGYDLFRRVDSDFALDSSPPERLCFRELDEELSVVSEVNLVAGGPRDMKRLPWSLLSYHAHTMPLYSLSWISFAICITASRITSA